MEALSPKFNNKPCFAETLWDGRSAALAVKGVCQLACNIFLILGPQRTIYIVVFLPCPNTKQLQFQMYSCACLAEHCIACMFVSSGGGDLGEGLVQSVFLYINLNIYFMKNVMQFYYRCELKIMNVSWSFQAVIYSDYAFLKQKTPHHT